MKCVSATSKLWFTMMLSCYIIRRAVTWFVVIEIRCYSTGEGGGET